MNSDCPRKKFWDSLFIKLLFQGAVLLFILFFIKNKLLAENNFEDPSLYSSSLIFSQNDYKKDDPSFLGDEYFRTRTKEGILTAINYPGDIQKEVSGEQESPPGERRENIKYIIKKGDVISTIASAYNLKTQTLLWANNLGEQSIIRPGDVLIIPPADGIIYKVKSGDTLGEIARKYSTDIEKIINFNQLSSDKIFEGQKLFLPDAKMPAPPPPTPRPVSRPTVVYRRPYSQGCHRFPYGYCTWYVAQKRCIPWGGNAGAWLYNARAYGYATGSEPAPGAIMVTRESWWGHVAYVESVSGDYVTISEMNKYGWGRVNWRTLHKDSWVIRGYIY